MGNVIRAFWLSSVDTPALTRAAVLDVARIYNPRRVPSAPRLLDRVPALRVRHHSPKTEDSYVRGTSHLVASLLYGARLRLMECCRLRHIDEASIVSLHNPPVGADIRDLVPYQGRPGRKRFIAPLKGDRERFGFKLDAKGFGFLGRGGAFYAPSSVVVLLRYLARRREADTAALGVLASAAQLSGVAHSLGIGMRTELAIAGAIVNEVWSDCGLPNPNDQG